MNFLRTTASTHRSKNNAAWHIVNYLEGFPRAVPASLACPEATPPSVCQKPLYTVTIDSIAVDLRRFAETASITHVNQSRERRTCFTT
jgi:hypothetical protein